MKTLSPLFIVALTMLAGCSADDLAGPDAATDGVSLTAQAHPTDTARPVASAPFSITGAWRAADRLGTITIFFNEDAPPILGTASASARVDGKGIISGVQREPVAVLVEGVYQRRSIEIALLDPSGTTLAKGQGSFSADRSVFKMVLLYESGLERPLEFHRL